MHKHVQVLDEHNVNSWIILYKNNAFLVTYNTIKIKTF